MKYRFDQEITPQDRIQRAAGPQADGQTTAAKPELLAMKQEAARLRSLSAQQKSKSENPYLLPQEGLQSPNPTAPGYVGTYSPTPPYEVESEKPIEANPAAPESPDSVP